jgi:hypothetical protein
MFLFHYTISHSIISTSALMCETLLYLPLKKGVIPISPKKLKRRLDSRK